MTEQTQDAIGYSKLAVSVPQNEANARMRKFFAAISAARQEYRIPDVYIIVMQNVETESGDAPGFATAQFGDESHAMQMCSYAMGFATAEHTKFALRARSAGMKLGSEAAIKAAEEHYGSLFGDEA